LPGIYAYLAVDAVENTFFAEDRSCRLSILLKIYRPDVWIIW
jgi:hypothetical protein